MNKQIKIGAILQYTQMALSILIGVIYTPIMLRMLGQSEYGLYNIASSIISYLSLLSLGFGGSYIRFYTIRKKENPEKIKNLNGLYLLTFILIGVVSIVSGLVLASNVTIFLNSTYTSQNIHTAKILMILLAINLGIAFPMGIFTSYITAQEKFIFLKLINIGKTVLAPGLAIISLFFGYGSIGLVVATMSIALFVDFINIFYCLKKLKMRFSLRNVEFRLLKDIFIFSLFIAINQLIDQINWQTDKVILGKMTTSAIVSVYAIGASLNTYFISFSTAISSLYGPRINRIVMENRSDCDDQLTKIMSSVGRVQFFILAGILIGFIFYGKYFVTRWAGEDYYDSYYIAILLMSPEIVPLIQNVGIEIQRAKNKHQFRSIVYLTMAIINVGISIWFCSLYGAIGTALGTTISIVIANILIMNWYYHWKLHLNMKYFWKEIIKIIPSLILPIGVGVFCAVLVPINNLGEFIRQIVVFIGVYLISIWALGFNKLEKKSIKRLLRI